MAVTKKVLTIDVNEDIYDIIAGKQGDANSRFLDVKLTDNGLPVNLTKHTVRFSAVKPDGRRIYNNCVITDTLNGRFQVELTNQTLAVPGKISVEFTLYGANETQVLTTKTFSIIVQENLFDEDAVESTNEFGAAVILFQDVAAVRDAIEYIKKYMESHLDLKMTELRAIMNSIIQYLDKLNGGITASLPRTTLMSHYIIVPNNSSATLLSVTGKGYISWINCPTNLAVTINIDGSEQSVTQMVNIGGAPGHVLLRFTSYCIITVQTTTSGQAYAGFLGALEF